jgi:hypothetical protein
MKLINIDYLRRKPNEGDVLFKISDKELTASLLVVPRQVPFTLPHLSIEKAPMGQFVLKDEGNLIWLPFSFVKEIVFGAIIDKCFNDAIKAEEKVDNIRKTRNLALKALLRAPKLASPPYDQLRSDLLRVHVTLLRIEDCLVIHWCPTPKTSTSKASQVSKFASNLLRLITAIVNAAEGYDDGSFEKIFQTTIYELELPSLIREYENTFPEGILKARKALETCKLGLEILKAIPKNDKLAQTKAFRNLKF